MSRSILVLYAHPRTETSRANRRLKRAAEGLEGVTVVDLYADYPAYDINVDREQKRLVDHDVIVMLHPVYWYSAPALVKEWIDLVLEWGWAYGPSGDKLTDKIYCHAVTAGGAQAAYSHEGSNRLDLRALFSPFEQTAILCNMLYLPPFALFDANDRSERQVLDDHAAMFARLLKGLRDETVDLERAAAMRSLTALYDSEAAKD